MFTTISNRFNSFLLILLVLMGAAIIAILATRSTAGPLDPTGAPSSTLPQVEPRIPIDHVPFTISTPGSYFLTKNVSGPATIGNNGITVSADDVTLDLNGFTVAGTAADGASACGCGINVTQNPGHNIAIRNGVVRDWNYGIIADHMQDSQIDAIRTYNNKHDGIRAGGATTISNCTASNNGDNGIVSFGSVVRSCVADANTTGICLCADTSSAIDNTITLPTTSATGISVKNLGSSVSNNIINGGGSSLTNLDVGIDVTGHGSSIHDNTLAFNDAGAGSAGVILHVGSGGSEVFHNYFCVAPRVSDVSAGINHVAPNEQVVTSLNPWANEGC